MPVTVHPAPANGTSAAKAVLAYQSTAQTLTHADSIPIVLDAEVFDTDGMHDTAVNNTRFTVPAGFGSGFLAIEALATFAAASEGTLRTLIIRKNGTTSYADGGSTFNATRPCRVPATALIDVAEGDYIEVMAFQDSGGDLALLTGLGKTRVSAHWIGANPLA